MARIAEQGARMEDMAEFISDMARKKDQQKVRVEGEMRPIKADYTRAERNIMQVAIKNVLGEKRVLVRTLDSVLENPKYTRYDKRLRQYRK